MKLVANSLKAGKKFSHCIYGTGLCFLAFVMAVATNTEEGRMSKVIGGTYNGHFGHVYGYANLKLISLHELARPWAKGMVNIKGMEQKSSVRVSNLHEVEQVATWERSTMVCQLWLGTKWKPNC
jgi:hypothetical protein